jgi:predicted short-subunit dehydrogenase-like oxidoreductase (DUF2520 family)
MSDGPGQMGAAADVRARRWAIVGAGRVGRTLGLLAERVGADVLATYNRSDQAAEATRALLDPGAALYGPLDQVKEALTDGVGVIWLTVADAALAEVAARLAAVVDPDQIVMHTAGSLASTVLAEAGVAAAVGSLHPLLAITDPRRAVDQLGEAAWTVEGDLRAVEFARALMAKVGVEPVEIASQQKPLYHASAVTAANLLVALMDAAFEMAEQSGMSRAQARAMLLPLARSCVDNLERQPTHQALSGPAARGDQETIAAHIEALEALGDEELVALYEVLAARAERIAGK